MRENNDPVRREIEGMEGPSVLWLLIFCSIGFWILQAAFALPVAGEAPGAISLEKLQRGEVWTLFTHPFIHPGMWPVHLVVNMVALWLFGRAVQHRVGQAHFAYIFLLSAWAGAACQLIFGFQGPYRSLTGASAGVFGVLAAFAVFFPNYSVTEPIRKVFPFRLQVRHLALGMVEANLLLDLVLRYTTPAHRNAVPDVVNVAYMAHVGGALAGWFYARQFLLRSERNFFPAQSHVPRFRLANDYEDDSPFYVGAARAATRQRVQGAESPATSAIPSEPISRKHYIQSQVDPILEKLHASGISSLSAQERAILDEAALMIGVDDDLQ